MKIPSKRELKQIALNQSSDIDFKDFIKIYKKCAADPYSFLLIHTTLPSDNLLRFRKKFFKIYYKIMTIDDQIKDERLHIILIDNLKKYEPDHQTSFINMNSFLVEKYYNLIKNK